MSGEVEDEVVLRSRNTALVLWVSEVTKIVEEAEVAKTGMAWSTQNF